MYGVIGCSGYAVVPCTAVPVGKGGKISLNYLGLGDSGKTTITIFLIPTITIVIISRY